MCNSCWLRTQINFVVEIRPTALLLESGRVTSMVSLCVEPPGTRGHCAHLRDNLNLGIGILQTTATRNPRDINRFHHRGKHFSRSSILASVTHSTMFRHTSVRHKHRAGAKQAGDMTNPPADETIGDGWNMRVLSTINDNTKYVVSAMVTVALLCQRDVRAAWWVVGSIASSVACKQIKELINETRPDGAKKSDPGMPSSHANSLAFLSIYVALDFIFLNGSSSSFAWAAVIVFGAVFLTWLRVLLGFHTTPQVLAGFFLGGSCAEIWWWFGQKMALPFFAASPTAVVWLYSFTAIASIAFGLWSLGRISKENDGMGKGVHPQKMKQ